MKIVNRGEKEGGRDQGFIGNEGAWLCVHVTV
nr:MAG TPA: hypothetical protein [Caudoviricetes sp.]